MAKQEVKLSCGVGNIFVEDMSLFNLSCGIGKIRISAEDMEAPKIQATLVSQTDVIQKRKLEQREGTTKGNQDGAKFLFKDTA